MRHKKNQNGFTLIEMMLYVALVSMILLSLTSFSLQLARARVKTRVIGEVEYAARMVQNRIGDAVRHAEAMNIGASSFDSDPGVLSLDMVAPGVDPTVFSLTADDGDFQISEAGGGAIPLTTDAVSITNLVFTNLTSDEDVGIIRVQFTVTANAASSDPFFTYEQSYQATFRIPLDID